VQAPSGPHSLTAIDMLEVSSAADKPSSYTEEHFRNWHTWPVSGSSSAGQGTV
jgi:hypothetical protein